jgi:hypothetical protein
LHSRFYFTFALNFHLHKDSARVKLIILNLQYWVAMFITTHLKKTFLYSASTLIIYIYTIYKNLSPYFFISIVSISTQPIYMPSISIAHISIHPQTTMSTQPISMPSISTPSSYQLSPTMCLHTKLHLSGSSEPLKPPSNRQLQLSHDATFRFYILHGWAFFQMPGTRTKPHGTIR